MVKNVNKFLGLVALLLGILIFYSPFLISGKAPIPSDTIIGLYHPFRDLYASTNPNGIPFKNFLITDPVRQTFVWKELTVKMWSQGNIPLWNPYEMAGKPLLANFQSGAFYPLNIIFLLSPFWVSWSLFILLQTVLSALFMYWYLTNIKVSRVSSSLGAFIFSFSSFSISWIEWGNIGHTALWLPLVLLSIDKAFESKKIIWFSLLSLALTCAFFAGHLQTFFYLFVLSFFYFLYRWFKSGKKDRRTIGFLLSFCAFFVFVLPQAFATIRFLSLSSRSIDQNYKSIEGWFLPFKHIIQIVAPDFFGNPTTLNYWGTWNYGELTIYVGVLPLILVFYSLLRRRGETTYYISVALISLLFVLPGVLSSIPFVFNVPFLSTAQPTRLIFLIMFSLSVLAAFGFDNISKLNKLSVRLFAPLVVVGSIYLTLWLVVFAHSPAFFPKGEDIVTAKRNLVFPTVLFVVSSGYMILSILIQSKKIKNIFLMLGFIIILFDLLRFGQKFTPFTSPMYLFPQTKILNYLNKQNGQFRIANLDRRIMPPNFFTHYKIQTIEGYDPLYLKNYAEYIVAMERGNPDVTPPYGFNRIITPHNYNSKLFDLLNVKYVLSFDELKSEKLTKVMEEGKTKLYVNDKAFERAFFVKNVIASRNPANTLFSIDPHNTAVISNTEGRDALNLGVGNVIISNYSENSVEILTKNNASGFLVLGDVYYPTWNAFIDGTKTQIFQTDMTLRGIFVPAGNHTILFRTTLF